MKNLVARLIAKNWPKLFVGRLGKESIRHLWVKVKLFSFDLFIFDPQISNSIDLNLFSHGNFSICVYWKKRSKRSTNWLKHVLVENQIIFLIYWIEKAYQNDVSLNRRFVSCYNVDLLWKNDEMIWKINLFQRKSIIGSFQYG